MIHQIVAKNERPCSSKRAGKAPSGAGEEDLASLVMLRFVLTWERKLLFDLLTFETILILNGGCQLLKRDLLGRDGIEHKYDKIHVYLTCNKLTTFTSIINNNSMATRL
jgi:hypothetical protein